MNVLQCGQRWRYGGPVPKEVDLESEIENDGRLVAKAIGTYSIFKAKGD